MKRMTTTAMTPSPPNTYFLGKAEDEEPSQHREHDEGEVCDQDQIREKGGSHLRESTRP